MFPCTAVPVIVTHLDSPSEFWVRYKTASERFTKMTEKLNVYCNSAKPMDVSQLQQGDM